MDASSCSLGAPASGALRDPSVIPTEGDGYIVPAAWRERESRYGTEELVHALIRAARQVAARYPGALAPVGDLSRRRGGSSQEHRSHHSGRDVDVFFYAIDNHGAAVAPGKAMLRFDRTGRAVRWSPPKGKPPPRERVPPHRFDIERNWFFVRSLLSDPEVEVQWIFIQRDLATRMLEHAGLTGEDPALLARAAFVMHQPSDSDPHDDHMHVRVFCDRDDRGYGCADRGPVRWWKKRWKYMGASYNRPDQSGGEERTDDSIVDLLRSRLAPVELLGALTS